MIIGPTELRPDNYPQNHVNRATPLLPVSNAFSTASCDPIHQSFSQVGNIVLPTLTVSSTIWARLEYILACLTLIIHDLIDFSSTPSLGSFALAEEGSPLDSGYLKQKRTSSQEYLILC